ncbi:copper resistance protein NlpE N-terminal domain-containing protein [Pontibacter cellulosilyticus]|uniref:Copper resistance protein NlpE N-terminal domain-containing protein n=1 Tax=Pontibacter cellulosilyticus TaxID=1720253 RepID=A0A923N9A5_9BACT|nr:copper resistance protein NlpE N-terminal domain-containing protein [Pontibacter cellulosilyticus]MBC5994611.1 copper resistance protein NlpE N-terminal domain-containing protein [Pontibacter cellulosilyticus]
MKRRNIVLWVWLVLWGSFASCSRNSQMDVEDWEDTEAVLVSTEVAPNDVIGTWHGFIPCPGCRGYTYDLVLMDNYNFEERVIYEDQPGEPVTRIGTWSVTDGIIELSGDEAARTRFSLSTAGELRALDLAGKPINQDLQAQYSLKRSAGLAEDDPRFWEDSRKIGVDFVATGHNPSWVLEIDKENQMLFKTRPEETVMLQAKTPAPTSKGRITSYRATTGDGSLEIELTQETCADAMSGKERPYTVRITANGEVYTGCGLYLGDNQSK